MNSIAIRLRIHGLLFFLLALNSALPVAAEFDTPFARLLNPHPAVNNQFGSSVAALDGKLVVGAALNDLGANHSGVIYTYDPQSQVRLQTILNPHPVNGAFFGEHIDALNGHMFASAPRGSTISPGHGVVYELDMNGQLIREFHDPAPSGFLFGRRFDAAGSLLAIGSEGQSGGVGGVHIFNLASGALVCSIANPNGGNADRFGNSLAFVGQSLAVGARENDTDGSNSGIVYLFDPISGALERTIRNPAPAPDDWFGWELAAYNDQLVIRALFSDSASQDAGWVALFDTTTGNLIRTFDHPTPASARYFGYSIAVDRQKLVIGSPNDQHLSGATGSAFVFNLETGGLIQSLADVGCCTPQDFGSDAVIVGDIVAVADELNGALNDDAGAVYLFHLVPEPMSVALLIGGIGFFPARIRRANGGGGYIVSHRADHFPYLDRQGLICEQSGDGRDPSSNSTICSVPIRARMAVKGAPPLSTAQPALGT